ncbi:MAG: peptidase S8 [Candidatus Eremiobacteraeota bacterium]|nr:peptidase S8 [Candidatus Eremiobacteraeota bacterium]
MQLAPTPQAAAQNTAGFALHGLSLTAFPSTLSAFPVSLSAFPVSLSAFPVCATTQNDDYRPIVSSGDREDSPTVASIPTPTPSPSSGSSDGRSSSYAPTAYVTPQPDHMPNPLTTPQPDRGPVSKCGGFVNNPIASIPKGTSPQLFPGYGPPHIQAMYGIASTAASAGAGKTVAIVTAFVDRNIESDLAVYRAAYGLPPCSVASGCLTIRVNLGDGKQHMAPSSWSAETALDTQMISAVCPLCKIVVVQAKSDQAQDLAESVDTAAGYHPVAISNSYAIPENQPATDQAKMISFAGHYRKSDMAITAGAGDHGYGVSYPASIESVVSVGGTTIHQKGDGSFAAPTVWSGTGSGCSVLFKKPSWQTDAGCAMRTANDIAILADPATGVMAFTSYNGGWNVFGGTSVGAPIVAAMYALAGTTPHMKDPSQLYVHAQSLHPISGSNGNCSPSYLCNGGVGYDGPSGLGAPYGLAAFASNLH